jgi:hypothetical protein
MKQLGYINFVSGDDLRGKCGQCASATILNFGALLKGKISIKYDRFVFGILLFVLVFFSILYFL